MTPSRRFSTPRRSASAALGGLIALAAATALLEPVAGAAPARPAARGFGLVGHDPLYARGMNAAPAIHGNYVYIGNRTDGQPHHDHPGILIVDISRPSKPKVVGEIGPPHAGNIGETTRELRVWPQKNLLIVLNFGCSSLIHQCAGGEARDSRVTFFDIRGKNATAPKLVATYVPSRDPHEFFLWVDPERPRRRAFLFQSTPTSSRERPSVIAVDISRARKQRFTEHAWIARFPAGKFKDGSSEDRRLHSLALSNDGRRAYLAFLGAGFLVLDTSEVVDGVENPKMRLVTPPKNRVHWSNPGAHTAVKLYGRDVVLVTDEVYGDALDALGPHGCPWGWVRMIDISRPRRPDVIGQYKLRYNRAKYCETAEGRDPANTFFTSYSSHNPTFTRRLAFVTWHSAGLEAFSTADPRAPVRTGRFVPRPLTFVRTEDPALSLGENKVVMWSYPIIKDGLIYVVDVRNGLYVLRYTGRGARSVRAIDFLEGNSNLGDALRLERAR